MTAALAEPVVRVGGRWRFAFAIGWLGIWMAQLAPYQLLLPNQVQAAVGPVARWEDAVVAFGTVSGIAGLCSIVAYPLTGALSDRTTGRFGRRTPWIAGGALLFGVGLIGLGPQTTLAGIALWWAIAMIGFCVLTAALTATISDRVPVGQRGVVAAWISAPQAIGVVVGLVLVQFVVTDARIGYLLLGLLVVLLLVPFLALRGDPVLHGSDRPPLTLRSLIAGFWIPPRTHPDFAWTLAGRILVNVGNALGTGLLLYFLEFGLRVQHADDALVVASLVYTVFVVIAALAGGRLSDRTGRRKPFVVTAAVLIAIASVLLAAVPDFLAVLVGAALLGFGYGAFLAVDQALATQVLPDPADRGKDLGIMNIATTLPQAVAPLGGAWLVAASGGFGALFAVAGIAALAGAACVLPVRSVR